MNTQPPVTSAGQFKLDLQIQKEVEVDGIGMGVLTNGTAYLNARGLARMCGVDHTLILRIGEQWGTNKEQPRVTRIRESLFSQNIVLDKPYFETVLDGTVHHAYIDSVCMAILEYYAFDAKQGSNEQALRNYRLLARNSLQRFIYERIGYDPNSGSVPVAWQQFHDRVTAAYTSIPAGYFSVFKEMADLIVELIRGGADVGIHFVPDISVGKAWSKHWTEAGLENSYGARLRYDHNYPDYFPQSAANPQPAFCYPETCLHEFRRWMREVYIPAKLPTYLSGKVRQGQLPRSFMESAALIFKDS